MFVFISGGSQPWDKFFIYHCNDVTMNYNALFRNFASKWLQKRYVKIEMMLKHVIKRISNGYGLDMIFIQLGECFQSSSQGSGIDNMHTTRWIKIISNPKPWEILYLFTAKTDKRSSNLPFSLCKVYAQIDKKNSLYSATHQANEEGTANNSEWIWILSLVVVFILCTFIGILLIYRRRKSKLLI